MPEPAPPNDLPWLTPGRLRAAEGWAAAALARLGLQAIGPLEVIHRRPWSGFGRFQTDAGPVYLKAPAPQLRFEGPLASALADRHRDVIVRPLEVEAETGWMLIPYAGDALRSNINVPADLHLWGPILRRYAGVQLDSADRVAEFQQIGVPDRRLAALPERYDLLLDDAEALRLGREGGLGKDEHRRLLALRSHLSDDCRRLADFGIPETIVHEEVHDANVLLADDGPRFVDWGDSSLGHPLTSILVMLRHPAYRMGLAESDPQVQALADAYLEGFAAFGSPSALRDAAAIAYRLAMVMRSLAYHAVFAPLPEWYRIEYDQISGWLQEFLKTHPTAGD